MVNLAILVGNLGHDPELRYTKNSTAVCTFSLATSEKRKGQDGQVQEFTEWHRVVAWSRLAEICGEYLQKGAKVYIEGKISTRKWTDQAGVDRYTTEIIAREMKMLGGIKEKTGGDGRQDHYTPPQTTGDDVPF